MLITKEVSTVWNSRTKNYYMDKGYKFTKMRDEIVVKVEDLKFNSEVVVELKCDYCGKLYSIKWSSRNENHKKALTNLDACKDCKHLKARETIKTRYGIDNLMDCKEFKDKRDDTNLEKYGCINPFGNKEIQENIKETCLEKYGFTSAMKNESIKEKVKTTSLKKYGEVSHMKLEKYKEMFRGENNPRWKGGVAYHRVERSTAQYLKWRKSVYYRDNHTCQCCKVRGGTINAHHIFNWKDYEELRYEVTNGITLCKECHMEFHSIYGKRNNSETQIAEFISNKTKTYAELARKEV